MTIDNKLQQLIADIDTEIENAHIELETTRTTKNNLEREYANTAGKLNDKVFDLLWDKFEANKKHNAELKYNIARLQTQKQLLKQALG